jgi:hypothetical protein
MNSQFLNKFWFCIRVSFIHSHSYPLKMVFGTSWS